MDDTKLRPGRWFYALASIIFIGGWIGFAAFMFSNLIGMNKKLEQVVVPGKSVLNLGKVGSYTIFYEYQSVVGNKIYSNGQELSGLEVHVTSKSTGEQVVLTPACSTGAYEFGGRAGKAIFDFKLKVPGEYEVSAAYPAGQEGPEVVLAVSHDFGVGIATSVLGGLAILFGSMLTAVALAGYTFIKRSSAFNRRKAERVVPADLSQG